MIYPMGTAIIGNGKAATTPFDELLDGVDDLIKRVADVENPDIRRTRAKVHAALVIAKNALKNAAHQVRNQPVPQQSSLDDSARVPELSQADSPDNPERNLGVALLLGLGLGLIVSLG
jgi:ElaB/YqjD/DUF883 family membrane-anchored ribosome-binding protein